MEEAKNMSFDELYGLGNVDLFLDKAKEKCEMKLRGKRFAGMETEDVVQEVLIKVHRSMEKYQSNKAKVSTFVDHVIENMIKDCYKKCATEKNLTLVNAVEIVDSYQGNEGMSSAQDKPSLTAQIGLEDVGFENTEVLLDFTYHLDLSDREAQIFQLFTQGYDFVEIAQILGVTKARISQIWKGIRLKYESL